MGWSFGRLQRVDAGGRTNIDEDIRGFQECSEVGKLRLDRVAEDVDTAASVPAPVAPEDDGPVFSSRSRGVRATRSLRSRRIVGGTHYTETVLFTEAPCGAHE